MDRLEVNPALQDSRGAAMRRKRNKFRTHDAPNMPMGDIPKVWSFTGLQPETPHHLSPIIEHFEGPSDSRDRMRWALRDSLDEVFDGQRTGRWHYEHLTKSEKTYLGTAIEVNITKEYEISDGIELDWNVSGIDIDCKFSRKVGSWEIPMEMYKCEDHGDRQGRKDHPALLVWMNDSTSQWAAGILEISDERLRWKIDRDTGNRRRVYNRDNKRRLSNACRDDVYWLWGGIQNDLPTNHILHMDESTRTKIFADSNSGQKRVNELFRRMQNEVIGRRTVLTVAQQDDAPKRARDARKDLRSEGIVILGHQDGHPKIAQTLGLKTASKGEWVSAKLSSVSEHDPRPRVKFGDKWWSIADDEDPCEAIQGDYRKVQDAIR